MHNTKPNILEYAMIPLQPDMPKHERWASNPSNMEKRRLGGSTTQAGPKLRQRGSMPTRVTPSAPPKVPYLSRIGAMEEQMGDRLLSITTQNTIRGALKSTFTKIIPGKTKVVSH